jgi:hypothetical protein
VIRDGAEDEAASPKISRALRGAGRWLLTCIESFPVPIEEAMWVEDFRHAEAGERPVTRHKMGP